MQSCMTSKQKIVVSGAPGTEIYHPKDMSMLGEIGADGSAKINISRNGYYPYLLSRKSNDDKVIPFGIDFKYKNQVPRSLLLGIPTLCWYYIIDLSYTNSDQFNFGFLYNKEQVINNRQNMPYANSGIRREVKKAFSTSSSLLKTKTSSENSILLQNDYGRRIEGEYKGTGKLQQGSNIIESYSNLKIRRPVLTVIECLLKYL